MMKNRDTKKSQIKVFAAIMAAGIVIAAYIAGFLFFGPYSEESGSKMVFTLTGMMFSAILFVACMLKNEEKTGTGNTLTLASALLFVIFIVCGAYDIVNGNPGRKAVTFALVTVSNILSAVIHLLFWHYQCASMPGNPARKLYTGMNCTAFVAYIALQTINVFTQFMFTIDPAGKLFYTRPGWIIEQGVVAVFYLIYLLYILPQHCPVPKKLSVASFAVFPVIGIVISVICITSGTVILDMSSTFVFLLLAAYVVFISDYNENRELMMRQKAELAESKAELMLSQINPHFAANTLNSIVALCRIDPPEAERAIRLFAGYLRENYVDMAGSQMISFEKELKNLENYLAIEKIRFPELVTEYDITCTWFQIPAMTLQPLVENAITHGIRGSGVIRVSAAELPDAYRIIVSDNGMGFKEPVPDGRKHMGIVNCRERLKILCDGVLTIRKPAGGGTECEILIPKKGNGNEDFMH